MSTPEERSAHQPTVVEAAPTEPAPQEQPQGVNNLPADFGANPRAKPYFTGGLLAVLVGVFGLEILGRINVGVGGGSDFGPSAPSLVAMGGVFRAAVREQHEWWRLLSAPMMHGGVLHLVLNGFSLFFVGLMLEAFVGRGYTAVLYTVGALGGTLASLFINPASLVSVGASGAIMGMLSAALLVAFRIPDDQGRTQIQGSLLRFLIPSLIPLATSASGQRIDYAAHFGGAVAGALAGLVLLALWDREKKAPRGLGVARALAVVCALAFAWAGVQAARAYPRYASELHTNALLIPESELPRTDEDGVRNAADLAQRFPHDPRALYFAAVGAQQRNELADAERKLRAALEEREIFRVQFPSGALEASIRARLADLLLNQEREADARAVLRPICVNGPDGPLRERIRAMNLCGTGPMVPLPQPQQ